MAAVNAAPLLLCIVTAILACASQVEGLCSEIVGGVKLGFQACQYLDSYRLSWNLTNGTVVKGAFTTRHDGWLAFGLSPEGYMVGSNVLIGYKDQAMDGGAKAMCYHLGAKDDSGIKPPCEPEFSVINSNAFYNGSHLALLFEIDLDERARNKDGTLRVVYAKGDGGGAGVARIEQHNTGDGRTASFDFRGGAPPKVAGSARDHLRRTHSIIQFLAFGVIIPVGPIFPRFFKSCDPLWFYTHAAIQTSGVVLGSTGFFLGLKLRQQYHSNVKGHYYIGIVIFALIILQVLVLVLRPRKDTKWRPWWNFAHQMIGNLIIFFGVLNIFIGFRLLRIRHSYIYIFSAVLGCFFIVSAVLEMCLRPGSRNDAIASAIAIPSLSRTHSGGRGPMTSESTGRFERL